MNGRTFLWFGVLLCMFGVGGCRSVEHGAFAPDLPRPPLTHSVAPRLAVPAPAVSTPEDLAEPPFRWFTVGYSVQGRPIEAVQLGRGPVRVLIIGSVHGNEPEGIALVDRLAELLTGQPELLEPATVVLVRNANPDGAAQGIRTNSRGVDLNRNFPASNWKPLRHPTRGGSGDEPLSEPETRVLARIIEHFRPQRIVAIHSTRGEPMVNFDGPARDLAERMSRLNGYPVRASIGYPTPGSLGNYAGRDLAIPIITLELPRGIDPEEAWQRNRDAILAVLQP